MAAQGIAPRSIASLAELAHFGECLSSSLSAEKRQRLHMWLLSGGFNAAFTFAAELRLTPALASEFLRKELLPPTRATVYETAALPPRLAAETVLQQHVQRQSVLLARLREIVDVLNDNDIVPVLIKGARCLWTGEPSWRSLRDLDILVIDRPTAMRSYDILRRAGYMPADGENPRPTHHHLQSLFRDDLPGWVEIHVRAGNRYAERVLPTETLLTTLHDSANGHGTVRLLSEPWHALHAMVHYHFGHSGFARGTLDLKGLYEFSWSMASMTEAQLNELADASLTHPSLVALLDLWLAAAADFYSLEIGPPFNIHEDAAGRWQRILHRRVTPSPTKYPGYTEEVAMSMSGARLRRQPDGTYLLARITKRASALAAVLPTLSH